MPGVVAPSRSARPARLSGLSNGRNGFKPLPRPTQRNSECGCDNPTFETVDGAKICLNCGTQVSEQNIVAEVTFGESSTGAATVEGGFVGENSRHARTLGAAASRRIGASFQARENTENNGREALRLYTGKLPIAPDVSDQALNIWKLAANDNFIQGRRADEVAGACLYAACRRNTHNTVLLMDIAEVITINVFALGDTYKELCKRLFMDVKGRTHLIEVEPLILKYAAKLEFGDKTRQVAEDAVRIIKRMKRDWIVTGRHPAGLCGACIILAARMNNFRRTVREVVFVVKVADLTVAKRLEEFKRTRSSNLTVNQFRTVGNRLKHQHDPPSLHAAEERAEKLAKLKRKRQQRAEGTIEIPDDRSDTASRAASATPQAEEAQIQPAEAAPVKRRKTTTTKKPSKAPPPKANNAQEHRRDADGFLVPNLPIDPALLAAANAAASEENVTARAESSPPEPMNAKKGPGRPRKDGTQATPPPAPTEDELVAETELQDEIENILRDDECIGAKDNIESEKLEEQAKTLAEQQRLAAAALNAQRLEQQGKRTQIISDSEIIGEDEFDDDPEVANCLLSEAQVKVKEMIWVAHNEDWLRAQQAKQLKRALEDAEGKGDKRQIKRRKRSRMGDGTVLEGGTPVESPADANRRMIEKRAPKGFSQRVNYAALGKIYGDRRTPTDSQASSEVGTPAPERESSADAGEVVEDTSAAANLPTPPTTQQAQAAVLQDKEGGKEAEADEEEEAEAETEDEDDAGDYWSENSPAPDDAHSPVLDDEDDEQDFDEATEDVTGNFGIEDEAEGDYGVY